MHNVNLILFTALQTLIPIPDTGVIQKYIAQSGDRVGLHCPILPGALQQHYSVIWTKDDVEIANSRFHDQSIRNPDSRYNIDGATYALIIDPVNVADSNSNYQCQVFVTNPTTDTKQQLQYYPQLASGVQLSLTVKENNNYYRKRDNFFLLSIVLASLGI